MSTLKGCYKDVKNLIQCLDPVVAQCQVTVSMPFSDPRISPHCPQHLLLITAVGPRCTGVPGYSILELQK